MTLELADISFSLNNFHFSDSLSNFNASTYFSFSSTSTRSSTFHKLSFNCTSHHSSHHTFFTLFPRLWNSLPPVKISLSKETIKLHVKKTFWNHFIVHFDPNNVCSYHYVCPCFSCANLPVNSMYS